MIRKIVKQVIIWFSNMQIRYFKDLCEPRLNEPEHVDGPYIVLMNNKFGAIRSHYPEREHFAYQDFTLYLDYTITVTSQMLMTLYF